MALKVVVTGGAGFIGSHLVERLLNEGHEVHVVDSFRTGRISNLAACANEPRLQVHELDVRDQTAVHDVLRGTQHVYHLAALADIVPSIEAPTDYATTNVTGTLNVVEAARQRGVARFVYAASSSCYGLPETYPTPEDAACRPEYPYALTKYLGEQVVLHWCKVYGLPAVSLRLFNVYGRRARSNGTYGAMFGVFLAQKLARKPMTVVGDGTQSRDFTHVSDVVEAFVRAGASELKGEVLNVGTGNPVPVNTIVDLLGGDVVTVPKRPGEPDRTHADVSKIARLLQWSATVSIERGVAELLRHLEDWKDAPVWTPDTIALSTRTWFERLGRTVHDAA